MSQNEPKKCAHPACRCGHLERQWNLLHPVGDQFGGPHRRHRTILRGCQMAGRSLPDFSRHQIAALGGRRQSRLAQRRHTAERRSASGLPGCVDAATGESESAVVFFGAITAIHRHPCSRHPANAHPRSHLHDPGTLYTHGLWLAVASRSTCLGEVRGQRRHEPLAFAHRRGGAAALRHAGAEIQSRLKAATTGYGKTCRNLRSAWFVWWAAPLRRCRQWA